MSTGIMSTIEKHRAHPMHEKKEAYHAVRLREMNSFRVRTDIPEITMTWNTIKSIHQSICGY